MDSTQLFGFHKEHGGVFTEGSVSKTPESYGDVNGEVYSVRNSLGIIDLSDRGKLKLSGKEHLKLLQGMLSNDVMKLESSNGLYAVSLTVKGKMITDMRLHKNDDYVLLDLEPGINLTFGPHLLKYRLSYKADIEDITESFCLFHLCGPGSAEHISSNLKLTEIPSEQYGSVKISADGLDALIIKINRTGETGYDIYTETNNGYRLWTALIKDSSAEELRPFGLKALDILRIEAGIPLLGRDMDDSTIPIEAGLWDALDFEKGCYIGQEVIARIKWRGRVNWHLCGFILEEENGSAGPGSEVYVEERKAGRVTSSVFSPTLGRSVSLGYIRREFNNEGQNIVIKTDDNSYLKAAVYALPFIDNFK